MVRRARFRALGRPPALHAPPEWRWPAAAHAVLPAGSGRGQPPGILVRMVAEASYPQIPRVPAAVRDSGASPPRKTRRAAGAALGYGECPRLTNREGANLPREGLSWAVVGNRHTIGTSPRFAAAVPPGRGPTSRRAAGLKGGQRRSDNRPTCLPVSSTDVSRREPRRGVSACDRFLPLLYILRSGLGTTRPSRSQPIGKGFLAHDFVSKTE